MSNIILLKKQLPTDECWAYLLRMKKVPDLTVGQILDKYQGFQGKRIAMHSLNGWDPDLKGMIDLFREIAAVGKYAMLCVDQGDSARGLLKGIERMGFDVGRAKMIGLFTPRFLMRCCLAIMRNCLVFMRF